MKVAESMEQETSGDCSNEKTPKSSRRMRAWSSNRGNAGADVDKAIMSIANSIAEHLKQIIITTTIIIIIIIIIITLFKCRMSLALKC